MTDPDWHLEWTWDTCVERYEHLKSRTNEDNFYHIAATKMLDLISIIRVDDTLPELTKLISHASLRLGLLDSKFRGPDLCISWAENDTFAIGFGLFGIFERATVPASKIVSAIKIYLTKLQEIHKWLELLPEANEKKPLPYERETKEYLLKNYSKLPPEWFATNVIFSIEEHFRSIKTTLINHLVSLPQDQKTNFYPEGIIKELHTIASIIEAAKEFDLDYRSRLLLERLEQNK